MSGEPGILPLQRAHEELGADFVDALGFSVSGDYGDPEAEVCAVRDSVGLFDQSYRGVLDLLGDGVQAMLHGVFSSNVASLTDGTGQPSCLLNAKGRLVAAFMLYRLSTDHFRIMTYEPLRESFIKSAQRYALLSDIDVKDATTEARVLSLQGPAAESILRSVSASTVALPGTREITQLDVGGATVPVVRGGESPEGGFELWVREDSLASVWDRLVRALESTNGALCGYRAAEVLRVEAGRARYGIDYNDDSFPNEIGWEHSLTFDKCYVGQEIVARMRTYGEVNRKLRGLVVDAAAELPVGAIVRSGDDEAGVVTSSVYSARLGKRLAVATIKRRHWTAATLVVDGIGGDCSTEQTDLPFVRLDGSVNSG